MEARFIRSLDTKVEQKQFYDAHQLCRAIFERFSKRKDLEGGLAFAERYADIFAANDQFELTVNLGQRCLELVRISDVPANSELMHRLLPYFLLCPAGSTETKYEYMNNLIQWSTGCIDLQDEEEKQCGSKILQALIADAYLAEEKFGLAQNHLVFCADGEALAELVVQWQAWGYPSEEHFFSLRLVCILLSRNKIDVAREVLQWLGVDWDDAELPAPLQATYLLWASANENCYELFQLVNRKYALIFRRDPGLGRLLGAIETTVFGVKQEQGGMMGMLKSLLQGTDANTPMAISQ